MRARALLLWLLLLICAGLPAQAHWTRLYAATSPPPRNQHAMVFDAIAGRCVLFGGLNTQFLGDTWAFDGSNWSNLQVAGPSPRAGHGMVFDEARGIMVLFGGRNSSTTFQDTWEWNGTGWSQRATTVHPPTRYYPGMAYDPQRQVTVLFGGVDSLALGDTWEWNGQDWVSRSAPVAPSARYGVMMAFDPSLGGVLLFGGSASNQPSSDETWRWDGSSWQLQHPANPPYARSGGAMVADRARRRVALWGGLSWDPLAWEWDGASWSARVLMAPTPRFAPAMAYDDFRRRVVLFAGGDNNTPFGDTWIYATDNLARFDRIGNGCTGTFGTAELANAPYSLPWIGDTFETEVSPTPANAAILFATGFQAASPIALDPIMPGCSSFVTVLEYQLMFASPAGEATWRLTIPNSTGLAGVELAQQVLIFDPPANAAGAVVSSAGKFTLGIR